MLTVLLFAPFLVALSVLVLGQNDRLAVGTAFWGSLVTLWIAVQTWLSYGGWALDSANNSMTVKAPWIPQLGISFHLGLDGLGALFVLLTAILGPVAVLVASFTVREKLQTFLILLMLLQGSLIGVFTSLDLVLFYFFWEAVLIPAYFMLGMWGGERRIYAAFKYVLYTMIGSLLMLVGILLLYATSSPHSFDLLDLLAHPLTPELQRPVFLAFALAFGIKAAVFPFHSWVPDVYTEANPSAAIMLSGVLSKMGIYGFLRFCLPLFPDAARYYAPAIMVLAVVGIVYGALLALQQHDIKRLVACSSVAHLGFITLGVFSLTLQGVQGATLQAVNHGITIAALFAIAAVIEARWGSTDLQKLGGLAAKAPIIAAIFLVVTLSSLGLPGLNGFAGEFLILLGVFQTNAADAVVGTVGVVLAAAYMMRAFQGVEHGPLGTAGQSGPSATPAGTVASWWSQMSVLQYTAILPLVALMVWIGIAPGGWLNPTLQFAQSILK